jgi:membrane carboxypeptidase/penicillin-binding protein
MDRPANIWPQTTGGGDAAPVWGGFMRRVYYGDPARAEADSLGSSLGLGPLLPLPEPWPVPTGIVTRRVDSKTGLLASRWCPEENAYTEYYLPGTEPTEYCEMGGLGIFRRLPGIR